MNAVWKARLHKLWRSWIAPFLVIVIVTSALRSSVADWNDVPSASMVPSILIGDRIFVNKLAYDLKVPFTPWRIAEWGGPQRGDIVVFYSPLDGTRLVKRVVGLPGDTIELADNRLIINGKRLDYQKDRPNVITRNDNGKEYHGFSAIEELGTHTHGIFVTQGVGSLRTFTPEVVKPGKYFMMGDNRDNSADSRYFGQVDKKLIVGRATAVVVSVDHDRHYAPRWQRFFTSLP